MCRKGQHRRWVEVLEKGGGGGKKVGSIEGVNHIVASSRKKQARKNKGEPIQRTIGKKNWGSFGFCTKRLWWKRGIGRNILCCARARREGVDPKTSITEQKNTKKNWGWLQKARTTGKEKEREMTRVGGNLIKKTSCGTTCLKRMQEEINQGSNGRREEKEGKKESEFLGKKTKKEERQEKTLHHRTERMGIKGQQGGNFIWIWGDKGSQEHRGELGKGEMKLAGGEEKQEKMLNRPQWEGGHNRERC